jgi:Arc/MetJ family transcription regulator
MRTTVTIDDKLYQNAIELMDPNLDKADIFREAMKAFVQRQSARRLIALGGTIPDMAEVPRRKPETAEE